tara:strand:+ start:898 stop:1356 length:459 start_codon:yes stop_codon:yes gene_type:complete
MQRLNFPFYSHKFKNKQNKTYIFDIIRKKYFVLTPEEWVRQNCILFLINEKKYPASLISVEKSFTVNNILKRYDVIIYTSSGLIKVLVECKSTKIKINSNTFDQIAQYNMTLNSEYLMVTNGLDHYFCKMDFESKTYDFMKTLPIYEHYNFI